MPIFFKVIKFFYQLKKYSHQAMIMLKFIPIIFVLKKLLLEQYFKFIFVKDYHEEYFHPINCYILSPLKTVLGDIFVLILL